MNVAWMYLDKKAAAIKAIKDFYCMEQIIRNYESSIEEARTRMTTHGSSVITTKKPSGAESPAETRIAESIDDIDVIKDRYRHALEFLSWFRPAWDALSDNERFILMSLFQSTSSRNAALYSICNKQFVTRATAYRLKDAALGRLALLLYGC